MREIEVPFCLSCIAVEGCALRLQLLQYNAVAMLQYLEQVIGELGEGPGCAPRHWAHPASPEGNNANQREGMFCPLTCLHKRASWGGFSSETSPACAFWVTSQL